MLTGLREHSVPHMGARKLALFVVCALLCLVSLSACNEDYGNLGGDMGDAQKMFKEAQRWHYMVLDSSEVTITEPYNQRNKLYLYASRNLIESGYDSTKCSIDGVPFRAVDSTYNISGPNGMALFLIGEIDIESLARQLVIEGDYPDGTLVLAYYDEDGR